MAANEHETQDRLHRLDQLDELLRHFRPIEQLFLVMGAVDTERDDGMAREYSEIGMSLVMNFRERLERAFGSTRGSGGS